MSKITLNKTKFFNNLDIIADKTKSKDKIALVLKDNAYGHGLELVAQMAQEYGITKAVVRTTSEAKIIENFFTYILVLADIPQMPDENIRYTINDIATIKKFPKGTKVELKVDTLMHRNGIAIDALEMALEAIKEQGLLLEAIFTHHRSADELTSEWFVQNKLFSQVKVKAKSLGYEELRYHSANSASLFRYGDFDEDMARIGIAAYGCLESSASTQEDLQPILSLSASKNSTRELTKGERVGYGGSYAMSVGAKVSNYDFGYADGFIRILSNNYTTPNGQKLLGKISMDNSSFLCEEEEIVIFNDAREIAKQAQTIPYEILTSLKAGIKREFL